MLDDGRIVLGASLASGYVTLQALTPLLALDEANGERRQALPAPADTDRLTYASYRADGAVYLCVTDISKPQPRCSGPLDQTSQVHCRDG
jgi:hypothetical protein